MRKRVVLAILALVLASTPVVVWLVSRRKLPVVFIDPNPGEFVFASEFKGKPTIDVTLPGGSRFQFPKKRRPPSDLADEAMVCGYIAIQAASIGRSPMVPAERLLPADVSFESASGRSAPIGTAMPVYVALPYAIDPQRKTFPLWLQGSRTRISLPTTNRFGSYLRKDSIAQAGPYRIRARAKPWLLSTAPLQFEFSIENVGDKTIRTLIGSAPDAQGDYQSGGSSGMVASWEGMDFIVTARKSAMMDFYPCENPEVSGHINVLQPEPVTLRAKRGLKSLQLFLPSGECVFGPKRISFERLKISAIEIDGVVWDGYGPINFIMIKDGDRVKAKLLRRGKEYAFSMKLDLPHFKPRTWSSFPFITAFWEVP